MLGLRMWIHLDLLQVLRLADLPVEQLRGYLRE